MGVYFFQEKQKHCALGRGFIEKLCKWSSFCTMFYNSVCCLCGKQNFCYQENLLSMRMKTAESWPCGKAETNPQDFGVLKENWSFWFRFSWLAYFWKRKHIDSCGAKPTVTNAMLYRGAVVLHWTTSLYYQKYFPFTQEIQMFMEEGAVKYIILSYRAAH